MEKNKISSEAGCLSITLLTLKAARKPASSRTLRRLQNNRRRIAPPTPPHRPIRDAARRPKPWLRALHAARKHAPVRSCTDAIRSHTRSPPRPPVAPARPDPFARASARPGVVGRSAPQRLMGSVAPRPSRAQNGPCRRAWVLF